MLLCSQANPFLVEANEPLKGEGLKKEIFLEIETIETVIRIGLYIINPDFPDRDSFRRSRG